jgi:diguanylate cyclase (GGDEF)-like protein/PAS domain S-box-containing protein
VRSPHTVRGAAHRPITWHVGKHAEDIAGLPSPLAWGLGAQANGPDGPNLERSLRERLASAPLCDMGAATRFAREFIAGAAHAAVFVFDLAYELHFAAGAALRNAGYVPDAMVALDMREVLPAESWRALAPHYQAVLAGEGARTFSYRSAARDRLYWVHAVPVGADTTIGAVVVTHDLAVPPADGSAHLAMTIDQLRGAVMTSPTALLLSDASGTCLFANPACAELMGRPVEQMIGLGIDDVVHPDDIAEVRAAVWGLLGDSDAQSQAEYRVVRPDGSHAYVVNSTTVFRDGRDGPRYLFSQILDLTSRRRAEQQLGRRLRQQSTVADFGRRAVSGDRGIDELMSEAVELVVRTLEVDRAGVLELDAARTSVVVRTCCPPETSGRRFDIAGTVVERVLAGCDAVALEDAALGEPPHSLPLRELDLRAALCVPIGSADDAFGVLGAYCHEPRAFHEDERHFLLSIANVLGDAVRRRDGDIEMRRQAMQDPVTGLPNRALLDDRLHHAVAAARRSGARVGVLFVDIDDFKVVNDSLGHQAGDELLAAVARRLRGVVRESDTVARFGGDEFVIVLEALRCEQDAVRMAEKVLDALSPAMVAGRVEHFIRASVGVSVSDPAVDIDATALLRDADTAMYRAKERGRGRYELLDDATRDKAHTRLRTEHELRRAVDAGELRAVFQPFARLADGSWFGAEALLRWQHPTRGLLAPDAFLDVAEQTGLIVPIGEWMLGEACRHGARWSREWGGDDFLLTVNVSPRQLTGAGIVETVRRSLAESGMRPELLGLEITEQALIAAEAETQTALAELQALGVKLLLDDFGTGYSSLSHLKHFPIDGIKIDRSFVAGVDSSASDVAIVRAILAMGWATGKFVIPEGVETPEQQDRLRRFGCRIGQGYLFGRPLDPGAIDDAMPRSGERASRVIDMPAPIERDFAGRAPRVLALLEAWLPESAVWIGQLDSEMDVLRVLATVGEPSFGLRPGMETDLETSLCHAMAGGASRLCGDLDQSDYAGLEMRRRLDIGSFVGSPLDVAGVTVGTLCAIAHGREAFTLDDLETLAFAARMLAGPLEAATAGGDVHEYLRRVHTALLPPRAAA